MEYLVKKIIAAYVDMDDSDIENEMSLEGDLNLEEIEIDDILDELEERLEIEFPQNLTGLYNVGDLIRMVDQLF